MPVSGFFRRVSDMKDLLAPGASAWRFIFFPAVIAVLVLSLLPSSSLPSMGGLSDKVQHAFAYLMLGVLGLVAWPRRAGTVLLALLAFGAVVEVLQGLSGSRSAEWGDLLADAIGLAVVGLVYTQRRRLVPAGA